MIKKIRLDQFLINKKLFKSKVQAQSEIMIGNILVDEKKITKPGTFIKENSKIKICKKKFYVSRGALKLKKAIDFFNICVKNKRCMDIGSSTGGFTEILLLNKAKIVYSIDVGYNQLDWKIRNNKKVVVLEKTNARYLELNKVGNILFDLIVIDVSFISLIKILKPMFNCLKKNGIVIALLKPQFELPKKEVNKNGVVLNIEKHIKIISETQKNINDLKFSMKGIINSPIKGKKGNIEYLYFLIKDDKNDKINNLEINKIVKNAFINL